jgi:nucleotide-binding universal stress UspA family protein
VAQNIYLNAFGAESFASIAPVLQQELEETARKELDERLLDSDASGPPTTGVVITASSPAFTIVDYAREHDIDLIVMGTHGRGAISHFLLGSVAERVVRLAPCPVLTIKHPEHDFVEPDALATVAKA